MAITFAKDTDGKVIRTDKHYVKTDISVDVAYYERKLRQIDSEMTMLTERKTELEAELTALQEALSA